MKYITIVIAETPEEIEKILANAKQCKAENKDFPFKVEGFLPAERIDEIIRSCHISLAKGCDKASFTFL